jgi:hypothetical protein
VRTEEHCVAQRVIGLDLAFEQNSCFRVESAHGLIEHEQRQTGHEGGEQPEFLAHSLGIYPDPLIEGGVLEPQVFGHVTGRAAIEVDAVVGQAETH